MNYICKILFQLKYFFQVTILTGLKKQTFINIKKIYITTNKMSSFNKNAVLKIMFFKKIGFLLQQSQLSVGRLHFLYLIIFYISYVYIGNM